MLTVLVVIDTVSDRAASIVTDYPVIDMQPPVRSALQHTVVFRPDLIGRDHLQLREALLAFGKQNKRLPVAVHALAHSFKRLPPIVSSSAHVAYRIPDVLQPGCCLVPGSCVGSVVNGIPSLAD